MDIFYCICSDEFYRLDKNGKPYLVSVDCFTDYGYYSDWKKAYIYVTGKNDEYNRIQKEHSDIFHGFYQRRLLEIYRVDKENSFIPVSDYEVSICKK